MANENADASTRAAPGYIRKAVASLAPYHFTRNAQRIKLDQNEAPDDLSAELRTAVLERIADASFNRYPDLHPVALEAALARRHDWPAEGVVVANGSNVLIQALVILAGVGRSVVTVRPSFSVYAEQARLLGAELEQVPLGERFSLPADDLMTAMNGRRGVLFLTDPAAPTGNAHDPAAIARVMNEAHASGRWLTVLDEAYHEYSGVDHAPLVRGLGSAVSLRTFSKAAGVAGARVGYALTHPAVAEQLRKVLLPFSVSIMQVAVALTVLERSHVTESRVARVRAERERVVAAMARLSGMEVFPSVTNFLLFRVDDPAAVHTALLSRDVVVRRQDHLPGAAGCLRVSIGESDENDAFLEALRAVLGSADGAAEGAAEGARLGAAQAAQR